MIKKLEKSNGPVLGFEVTGKLHDDDYKQFVPAVDEAIKAHGKVRLLVHFEDFHGWDARALWDDMKFAASHFTKVHRVAIVGDKAWEKAMGIVCKPFTLAKVQYFDKADLDVAWHWVGSLD
ncbi:MAG TPA: STAS/SEC14 domain-containing protein [Verrucomicrobiae bacterium]|nr:STAS/SEC14 domain-containing protein [Verrucomicrobiae bacterium]